VNILSRIGTEDVAYIYLADLRDDPRTTVEFVDATDGGIPRCEKWVVNVSTQFGCPVGCRMCDAGSHYFGNCTADEMLQQIDYVVASREQGPEVNTEKFKVHFARMGEPALNREVLDVLAKLPSRYSTPNLIPGLPTIAPRNTHNFLEKLRSLKNEHYANGRFQLQFSINSTDESVRDTLMPFPKWSMEEIARFGRHWLSPNDRKVTLNLAVARDIPVDAKVLGDLFDPDTFLIKLTPMNPTESARREGLKTMVSAELPHGVNAISSGLEEMGFDVIVSIGSPLEDEVGSNCGEAVLSWRRDLEKDRS